MSSGSPSTHKHKPYTSRKITSRQLRRDDTCMDYFSADQVAQMQAAFQAYRQPTPPPPPLPPPARPPPRVPPASHPAQPLLPGKHSPSPSPAQAAPTMPMGTSTPAALVAADQDRHPPPDASATCKTQLEVYSQCGGEGGSCAEGGCMDAPFADSCCPSTTVCVRSNAYYWQCL